MAYSALPSSGTSWKIPHACHRITGILAGTPAHHQPMNVHSATPTSRARHRELGPHVSTECPIAHILPRTPLEVGKQA